MKRVHLAYGRDGLSLELPDHCHVLRPRHTPGLPDEPSALLRALREPIGCAPLASQLRPGNKVVVVHTDITRATPNDRILLVLLPELEAAGIGRADITLLNALGTHRPQTPAELRELLGPDIVARYRCLQHDAHDDANLVALAPGLRVNRAYVEADVRILTGFIEPHFFAGFSGGPKGVLPAIAGAESVQSNHGFHMIAHPNATWGITTGNPVWEQMRDAALRAGPSFLLNVALNSARQITGIFAGDLLAAHTAGCAFVREHAMVAVDAPYDLVITTNSGYPLDQNLYQCIKGVSAAARIVRDGGTILLAGQCADGLPAGSGYERLLVEAGSPARVLELLGQPGYERPDQWTVQIQAQIQQRANVFIFSDRLSDADIRRALLTPCRDIAGAVAACGPAARVAVLPDGPQTIAYLPSPTPAHMLAPS
jgi:nickel-dependent lactate racemase